MTENYLLLEDGSYFTLEDGSYLILGDILDDIIPLFGNGYATDIKPRGIIVSNTDSQVFNQGITYNQLGLTYNENLYAYGGVYGYQNIIPLLNIAVNRIPNIIVGKTTQQVFDPGITFNQINITYDNSLYAYGGLYGFADIPSIVSLVDSPTPSIVNIDIN